MRHEIFWFGDTQELMFIVEENGQGNILHWVSHPFLVGQLVAKNPDLVLAQASTGQPFTGRQILNMFINVPRQTFDAVSHTIK